MPPTELTYCGCNAFTQEFWDTLATNGDETFSCGARILHLQNDRDYSESGACEKVISEFPDICTCDLKYGALPVIEIM